MTTSQQYLGELGNRLKTFDRQGAEFVCNNLITHLYTTEEAFEARDAEKVMQLLRNKRMFQIMQQVGDAFIQTNRQTFKLRKLYAQALIDQNILTAARCILKELITDTANASAGDNYAQEEYIEARGLMGRLYKQLYVNASQPSVTHNINFIKEAIKHYLEVYESDPQTYTWHGINVVALVYRARNDGIHTSEFPHPESIATNVLNTIREKYEKEKATAWDFATAGEACIALNRPEEALEWYSGYARMPYCDAFELASTLRQLEEVWRLSMDIQSGKLVLPLLRSELLKREGGCFIIDAEELQKQKTAEAITEEKYNFLAKKGVEGKSLEKVFGEESFNTYKWYMTGADRCLAVARIGRDTTKGFGTGFLLKGNALHSSLDDELVLITNAHVVSDDLNEKSLRPEEAIIIFEALNREEEFRAGAIFWSSPSIDLDATIIRFSKEDQERLKELTKNISIYPVSKNLPIIDSVGTTQRIYIIGHPFGGTLQLSFQDNLLLDHQDPKIHYRTPTVGGSSGSPVFNQQWELIGLHHSGSTEMNRLNGKPGTYEANEGIWIQSIKKALMKEFG